MPVKQQIQSLLTELNKDVLEKEEVIALALLCALAGESIFLLGPPGVAKSLVARRLKFAFKDERRPFEYLMNRFSTPDEIFGPVSISQLKDHDKYVRITKNYLPEAPVVFLDEIWKAGPSIQNALLTVLNEKIYRNGDQEVRLPMKALISASNELPPEKEQEAGQSVGALWDRFLVRLYVDGVRDRKNFESMISKPLASYEDNVPEALKITDSQYHEIAGAVNQVSVPENVFQIIHGIRCRIQEFNDKEENHGQPLKVSDRRWRKIVRLLQTSAFLNDRQEVDLMDCFLIQHCLWDKDSQFPQVGLFVKEAVGQHAYQVDLHLEDTLPQIDRIREDVEKNTREEKEIQNGRKINRKIVWRQPHPAVKKHWDDQLELMLAESSGAKARILELKTRNQGTDHLFVPGKYLQIVDSNFDQALHQIEKIEIEVKRIRNEYESIPPGDPIKVEPSAAGSRELAGKAGSSTSFKLWKGPDEDDD